ncbi:F-box and leucine-rich repeat protein 4 [Tieghemiomyces parasiticus]|uniref:F-box and leucine-rich repeat protein 4 n=1 Tax=Tieghemiomyces parasiticus TaxID=78921 RepID=A0A9W8A693_9FUNG|nr:F-box and leucine-rich repeat protein 4 [Tieghemiomyces parasiticus]
MKPVPAFVNGSARSSPAPIRLVQIPVDVLLQVFGCLGLADRYRLGRTCRALYAVYCEPENWAAVDWRPYGARITDVHLEWLARLAGPCLRTLCLKESNQVSDSHGLGLILRTAPQLHRLVVDAGASGSLVGQRDLFAVVQAPRPALTECRFDNCTAFDDASLVACVARFPNLTRVSLRYCVHLQDVRSLRHLPNLAHLNLTGVAFRVDQLTQVLSSCQDLRSLTLDYCYQVDDDVLMAVARHNRRLRSLSINFCCDVTSRGVSLLVGCPSLTWLGLRNCRAVSSAVIELVASCTTLRQVLTPLGKWRFWIH